MKKRNGPAPVYPCSMTRMDFYRACGEHLQAVLVSMSIGIAVATIYGMGHGGGWVEILVSGAVVGFAIYVIISILETLFRPSLARVSRGTALAGHMILFLLGGTIGWISGVYIVTWILGGEVSIAGLFKGSALPFMLMTGAIAVVVGLTFRSFEHLHERLRDREWAEKELALARSIQTRLLPPQSIEGDGFSIAARNIPAHVVAGDFYDFVRLDDGSVVIVVGDVAGKGMGAALIMASVKAVLPFVARGSVTDAMTMLNAKLVTELDRREFVALVCVRYFPEDGTLHVANAGCPDPYIVGSDGVRAIGVEGTRLPLGIRNDITYTTTTVQLARGERLVLVTDGIPEAPIRGEVLGYERFVEILQAADANIDALLADVQREVDDVVADDWTLVTLTRAR